MGNCLKEEKDEEQFSIELVNKIKEPHFIDKLSSYNKLSNLTYIICKNKHVKFQNTEEFFTFLYDLLDKKNIKSLNPLRSCFINYDYIIGSTYPDNEMFIYFLEDNEVFTEYIFQIIKVL